MSESKQDPSRDQDDLHNPPLKQAASLVNSAPMATGVRNKEWRECRFPSDDVGGSR